MNILKIIFLMIFILSVSITGSEFNTSKLKPRKKFLIPLQKITIKKDKKYSGWKIVYIYSRGYKSHSEISKKNDLLVLNSDHRIQRTIYAEPVSSEHVLSKFEKKTVNRVNNSLEKTLKILSSIIDGENYDKCRYLDGYFPKFLKGYYFLTLAQFSNKEALPLSANFPSKLFDPSLSSPKTDQRIAVWQNSKSKREELITATKSLIEHLHNWDKKASIDPTNHNAIVGYSKELQKAYSLFIKKYFNL